MSTLKLLDETSGPGGVLRRYAHTRFGVIETMTTWDHAGGPAVIRVEHLARRDAAIRAVAQALKVVHRSETINKRTFNYAR